MIKPRMAGSYPVDFASSAQRGARFSKKALTPSRPSSLRRHVANASDARSSTVSRGTVGGRAGAGRAAADLLDDLRERRVEVG
jgi:hypothetical protein